MVLAVLLPKEVERKFPMLLELMADLVEVWQGALGWFGWGLAGGGGTALFPGAVRSIGRSAARGGRRREIGPDTRVRCFG